MKAIVQTKYGSADDLELREVAVPSPGDDEVLVRVRATSLHPDVWHVVAGRPYVLRLLGAGVLRPRNPIPGSDVAGIVERVGSRVTSLHVGDEVFGETTTTNMWTHGGALAELVRVGEDALARKPANVTFEQAASVPTSGIIALQNLRGAQHDWRGHDVAIIGAGGGVGTIALQVAKACGARVTAVDSALKQGLLRALGADEVVDYAREDLMQRGTRYDLIVDIPATRPLATFRPALKPDGRYIPIGHEGFGAAGRRVFGLIPHFLAMMLAARFVRQLRGPRVPRPGRTEILATLRDLLEAGTLTPVIDSVYPLSRTREAFRRMIGGEAVGKVIVSPPA